jgi:hypothetical protein
MPRAVQCHKRPLRQLCSPQPPAFHSKQQRFVGSINQRATSSCLLCLDQLLRIAIIGKLAKSVIGEHRYYAMLLRYGYELHDHLYINDSYLHVASISTFTTRAALEDF